MGIVSFQKFSKSLYFRRVSLRLTSLSLSLSLQWVNEQRKAWNIGKLSEVRETALIKLGFVWDGKEEYLLRHAEGWNKNFEHLKKFKERTGHFPPLNSKGLGNFLTNNRHYFRKWNKTGEYIKGFTHLAEERFEKFKSIGAI